MVEIGNVKEVIKDYIIKQLVSMGESSPAIRLLIPLAKRAITNNINSFDKFLKPIADKDGMIDIEGIFDEEMEVINNIDNFNFDIPFIGGGNISKGIISLEIPLYHVKDNKKYIGEKYDINKAHEICERYKEVLPNDVEPCDVYVAINAQYHDYAKLFEEWFGGNIDNKVFESAITFWFKDVDFDSDKVWEYFHMNN